MHYAEGMIPFCIFDTSGFANFDLCKSGFANFDLCAATAVLRCMLRHAGLFTLLPAAGILANSSDHCGSPKLHPADITSKPPVGTGGELPKQWRMTSCLQDEALDYLSDQKC